MAFEDLKERVHLIPTEIEDLVKSNMEYYKLSIFRLLVKGASGFLKVFIIGMASLLFSFFLATAAAFAVGELLGSYALGFACIGGAFFLIVLLIILLRKYLIDRPLLIKLSAFYFDDEQENKTLIHKENE